MFVCARVRAHVCSCVRVCVRACARACVSAYVWVGVVYGCVRGVGVCVRTYVFECKCCCAHYCVSYTSRMKLVHIVKFVANFFLNWTCSCCVLFALYSWNVAKTNSSAHPFILASLSDRKYPGPEYL